jgi:hypothetical protein
MYPRIQEKEGGCWEWDGEMDESYRAITKIGGHHCRVHRLLYTLLVRGIGPGMDLHHECRNPWCVNPEHMRPMTRREHQSEHLDLVEARGSKKPKTHCKRGHEFTVENTWMRKEGNRVCRICNGIRLKEWQAKNPERWRAKRREQKRRKRERGKGVVVDLT